jgi:hypothetical protein
MGFKNVLLEEEEASKWAEYFAKKYPQNNGFTGFSSTWSGMTVNDEQTIFVATERVNHDDPDEIELYYFWHDYLFSIEMRKIWGEEDLEAWEFYRLMSYPNFKYKRGVHLPIELEHEEEKIFQDLKEALIIYGRKGIGVEGYEYLDPPKPNIELRVEGRVY